MTTPNTPLWRSLFAAATALRHKHVGSLHASDATLALQAARDIYTRRGEGLSIWVVPSNAITASDPSEKGMMFEPRIKIYRHPTFYDVPDEVGQYVAISLMGCSRGSRSSLRAKRSNPSRAGRKTGLLRRGACHRARIRATRWLLA